MPYYKLKSILGAQGLECCRCGEKAVEPEGIKTQIAVKPRGPQQPAALLAPMPVVGHVTQQPQNHDCNMDLVGP